MQQHRQKQKKVKVKNEIHSKVENEKGKVEKKKGKVRKDTISHMSIWVCNLPFLFRKNHHEKGRKQNTQVEIKKGKVKKACPVY